MRVKLHVLQCPCRNTDHRRYAKSLRSPGTRVRVHRQKTKKGGTKTGGGLGYHQRFRSPFFWEASRTQTTHVEFKSPTCPIGVGKLRFSFQLVREMGKGAAAESRTTRRERRADSARYCWISPPAARRDNFLYAWLEPIMSRECKVRKGSRGGFFRTVCQLGVP